MASRDRAIGGGLALVGGLPSIVWGMLGADYLTDDFWVALGLERDGIVAGVSDLAFVAPARPAAALYYLMIYQGIGEHPLLQALLMAAINGAAAVLVWLALRCVVQERTAVLTAMLFAVGPNRGATRMWFVVGSYPLAVACVAGAAVVLYRRDRIGWAGALLVTGVLLYEGVAAVALLVLVPWVLEDTRSRWRSALIAAGSVVAVILASFAISPKRGQGGPSPFESLETISHGLFGRGFWGQSGLGDIAVIASAAGLVVTLACTLPAFRRKGHLQREALLGWALVAAGALPFVVGGAPFAVQGIFERNNLVAGLGVCLLLGALLNVISSRWRFGPAVVAVVVGWLLIGNVRDVRDYLDAVDRGDSLVAGITADVNPRIGSVFVTPPITASFGSEQTGVEQFILNSDLPAALELRLGREWSSVTMPVTAESCHALVRGELAQDEPVFVYDWRHRTLRRATEPADCATG